MVKHGIAYLDVEPNLIRETGFHKDRSKVSESLFSLSNEYMGVRGYFEEGCSGAATLRGNYVNGLYAYALKDEPTSYRGIETRTHFMVNTVDFLGIELWADGEQLDLGTSSFSSFTRCLPFREGKLTRSFVWELRNGKKVKVSFERFLSLSHYHLCLQRVSLESGEEVSISLSFKTGNPLLTWGDHAYLHEKAREVEKGLLCYETENTEQMAYIASSLFGHGGVKAERKEIQGGFADEISFVLSSKAVFDKAVAVVTSRDEMKVDPREFAVGEASYGATHFDELAEENAASYSAFYDDLGLEIKGNALDEQGLAFCLFQLHSTYRGLSGKDNLGAKGLTGEAYSGHAFWDTETYCLPFYLLNDPDAAKSLLLYREKTLPLAKEKARKLDCRGAAYPIATLDGREGCTLFQHASLQLQPSTGVVYGFYHYEKTTGDFDFVLEHGARPILNVALFLLSRGGYAQDGRGFGFYGVMGPDEFKMMVNNNYYTNVMGRFAFEYCLRIMSALPESKRKALLAEEGASESDLEEMKKAAASMYLPASKENPDLYEQDDSFFELPHVAIDSIPREQFPLYGHWSYDRLYRTDMIKQPDVLMYCFLFLSKMSQGVLRSNFDYYEPRCIHESSLSPSIHSILAAAIGEKEKAAGYFSFATRLDLDDYNNNTGEGLHLTSLAAAYLNVLYGFAGLRTDGDLLEIDPYLPDRYESYAINFLYRGRRLRLEVSKDCTRLALVEGKPLVCRVRGKETTIDGTLSI